MINNKPRNYVGDYEVELLRAASLNRGKWVYKVVKHGLNAGMTWDDIREAIRRIGAYNGYNVYPRTNDIKEFAKAFCTDTLMKMNDAEVAKLTDDEFTFVVHHCPMVDAWLRFTDDEEFIAELCDACMEIDRGTMATYGWNLELKETIGKGDDKCTICMKKCNK